ncbi:MAG: hypothetical protein ACI83D_000167 [Planctomycetota bacterium]|jgi:hypothetical protein
MKKHYRYFVLFSILLYSCTISAQVDTPGCSPYADLTVINGTPVGLDLEVIWATDYRDTSTYKRFQIHVLADEIGWIFCGNEDMPDTIYFAIVFKEYYPVTKTVPTRYDSAIRECSKELAPTYSYKNGIRFHQFGRDYKDQFFIWSLMPNLQKNAEKRPDRANRAKK